MSEIRIYCDGASHHPRHVPVTNFRPTSDGTWHEIPASRAGSTAGTGYTLHGSDVDKRGWALAEPTGAHRVNFELICRKCKHKYPLTETKLTSALNAIRDVGESQVSLVALAAIVQKQAEQ